MNVWKKILVITITVVILFGSGLLAGYGICKAVDNKRFREYQDTVDSLGLQIAELNEGYQRLAESNQRLEKEASGLRDQLTDAVIRAGEAEAVIVGIHGELSTATNDIQRLIDAIGRVIEKIRLFGETQ